MPRENFNDLLAFIAVARERSFTRAAAQLGVSQSALSHTIRALESRLGLRLLTRTTRSVSPTEAGDRILQRVAPRFGEIEAELMAVTELRDKPAGTIRITATDHATNTVLWPKLSKVLHKYPEIKVEIMTDYGLTDIVADRYDIGIRHGDQVAKDMIAVRIAADMKMAIVGSPTYLENKPQPKKPQDLMQHNCINLRLPTLGGFYAWELKKAVVKFRCVWRGSSHSMAAITCSTPRWRAMVLPTCHRIWCRLTSRRDALFACSTTGAQRFQVYTRTTRVVRSLHGPWRWLSIRCVIVRKRAEGSAAFPGAAAVLADFNEAAVRSAAE